MDRSRAASLIVQTFSPASEASRPELFAGRETAIELLTESLHDHGAVSVLYGPRGIGKTSLARQLELIARGDTTLLQRLGLGGMSFGVADYFDVIAIDAGSLDQSLAELEAAIAREVRRLSPQPAMREVRRTTKLGIGIKGLSGGTESQYEPTPNEDGLSLLSILRSRLEESLGRPLLAIVDEFDQFSSTPGVANWVHSLPSDLVRVAFCGIAGDYHELLGQHPSLARKLRPVQVKPMGATEIEEVLTLASRELSRQGVDLQASPAAIAEIVRWSDGFPWFAQYLGRESFKSASARMRTQVSPEDVNRARVALATEHWALKFSEPYERVSRAGANVESALRFLATNSRGTDGAVPRSLLGRYLADLDPEIDAIAVIEALKSLGIVNVDGGRDDALLRFVDAEFRVFTVLTPPRHMNRDEPRVRSLAEGAEVRPEYRPRIAQSSWQARWATTAEHRRAPRDRDETLILLNLTVESLGDAHARVMHVTHARRAVFLDVVARYRQMSGDDVQRRVSISLPGWPPATEWDRFYAEAERLEPQIRGDLRSLGIPSKDLAIVNLSAREHHLWSQVLFSKLLQRGVLNCVESRENEGRASQDTERAGRFWVVRVRKSTAERLALSPRPGVIYEDATGLLLRVASESGAPRYPLGIAVPVTDCRMCGLVSVRTDELPIEASRASLRCAKCDAPAELVGGEIFWSFLAGWVDQRDMSDIGEASAGVQLNLRKGARSFERIVPTVQESHTEISERMLTGALFDAGLIDDAAIATARAREVVAEIVVGDYRMSKSLGNVVALDSVLHVWGADTFRIALMWAARSSNVLAWDEERLGSARRFLWNVWRLMIRGAEAPPARQRDIDLQADRALLEVTRALDQRYVHATQRPLRRLLKILSSQGGTAHSREILCQLLAPLVPHLAADIWATWYPGQDITELTWPGVDLAAAQEGLMDVGVHVDAKKRFTLALPPDTSEDDVVTIARRELTARGEAKGSTSTRVIVRLPRTINFV